MKKKISEWFRDKIQNRIDDEEFEIMQNGFKRINREKDQVNQLIFFLRSFVLHLFIALLIYRVLPKLYCLKSTYEAIYEVVGFISFDKWLWLYVILCIFGLIYFTLKEIAFFRWEKLDFVKNKVVKKFYEHFLYEIPQRYLNIFEGLYVVQYCYFVMSANTHHIRWMGFFYVLCGIFCDFNFIINDDSKYYFLHSQRMELESREHVDNDDPICNRNDLNHNLKEMSDNLFGYIRSLTQEKMGIIAVTGRWGTGKTSTVQTTLWRIREKVVDEFFICEIDCKRFTNQELLMYVNLYLEQLLDRYNVNIRVLGSASTYIESVIELITESNQKTKWLNIFTKFQDVYEDYSLQRKRFEMKIQSLLKRSGRKNIIFVFDDLERNENYSVILPVLNDILNIKGITSIIIAGEKIDDTPDFNKYYSIKFRVEDVPEEQIIHREQRQFLKYCNAKNGDTLVDIQLKNEKTWSIFNDEKTNKISQIYDLIQYDALKKMDYSLEMDPLKQYIEKKCCKYLQSCEEFAIKVENELGEIGLTALINIVYLAQNIMKVQYDEEKDYFELEEVDEEEIKEKIQDRILGNFSPQELSQAVHMAYICCSEKHKNIQDRNTYEIGMKRIEYIKEVMERYKSLLSNIDMINNKLRENKERWRRSIWIKKPYLQLIIEECFETQLDEKQKIEKSLYSMYAYNSFVDFQDYTYVRVKLNVIDFAEHGKYIIKINEYLRDSKQAQKCIYEYKKIEGTAAERHQQYNSYVSEYIRSKEKKEYTYLDKKNIIDILQKVNKL